MIIESEYLTLDATYQGLSLQEIADYGKKVLPENFDHLREQLLKGEFENRSEGRKVTHCLARSIHNVVTAREGKNRFCEVVQLLRSGRWLGATGKPITDVVNIGVGGSDLGPMMGSFALKEFADDAQLHDLNVHFVSSMDGGQLYAVLPIIDPETTLFIIASKSFTTIDTFANVDTVRAWIEPMLSQEQWLQRHVIGVSASAQKMTDYGIPPAQQFTFDEGVGGRFSMWTAIGLAIALSCGITVFKQMLEGARAMDEHFGSQPLERNIPLLMALYGVYNRWERDINNLAILPYDGRLRYLPNYLQQLDMESNGKNYTYDNKPIDYPTGPIIWGGFGPNGQHAFFQHLHQGTEAFTADFVVVLDRDSKKFNKKVVAKLKQQQRLAVENCLAHRQLLYFGAEAAAQRPDLAYAGGHKSSLLVVEKLTPKSFGGLIATYEHKVYAQGLIFKVNSFDQPGVEKGKVNAVDLGRTSLLVGTSNVKIVDCSTRYSLEKLHKLMCGEV
ncbi:glucose-6-phosphate isomerase [Idiomarina tyrosinivorans]|uniref:glucose-6-phosphate isomerase n=1 Tax=Idiomarina tyrosinivorans TaxID=1445662 RepID=UPI003B846965